MENARKTALDALLAVRDGGAYSNIALANILSQSSLSEKDRAFASALFYGTLDRLITLDFVLSKFIKKPLEKTLPITLGCLRIALYQIMYMDRVPDSAAVSEAVNIVKRSKERFNASFVNGVLRSILRSGITLPQGDTPEALSVRYSCPKPIVDSFIHDYGTETAKNLLEKSLEAPPVSLRVNSIKISAENLVLQLSKENITAVYVSDNTLTVKGGINLSKSKCFKNGFFHIQDVACQTAIKALCPRPGERILDMCSAPGGKAFTAAEIMENRGEILACDIHKHRVDLIKQGAERMGLDIIKPQVSDALYYNKSFGKFDAVICDVPCSGLGVIRRKPEIKYKSFEDFSDIEAVQRRIIENAGLYLKPGGRLLYSTCTLRNAENNCVVHGFLDKHTHYELKYEHTFMPHLDGTDGFYCAVLLKTGD